MADPLSLLRPAKPANDPRQNPPAAAFGGDPRQPAPAVPSSFDWLFKRGKVVNEFHDRRAAIIKEQLREKKRTRKKFRRDREKYLEKIKRGDKKTAWQFGIREPQRHTKSGLEDREQKRLLHRSIKLVEKEMRIQQRGALRAIEKQSTAQVRQVGKDLRQGMYNTAA